MMQQSPLDSTKTLPPAVRAALESLLGRALRDEESVSVRAYEPHEAQSQEAALRRLKRHFDQIDEQLKTVSNEEHTRAIEEALRSVRPGYRSER